MNRLSHPTDAGGYPAYRLFSLTDDPGKVHAVLATASATHPLTPSLVDLALCLVTAFGRTKLYKDRPAKLCTHQHDLSVLVLQYQALTKEEGTYFDATLHTKCNKH